ncbi:MAG TPA: class I SAM-dependent methyltransferase [Pirellulales bacterium]|jgi:SAM-dependent methyltransferase|nr:class I SAM-dependent methyltransferase [Pirellulales bacterium]
MSHAEVYDSDLAYVHDRGFGGFARGSAPGLLGLLRQAGITQGRIVDLGCGSGIWSRQLVDAGFEVTGVDLSSAMIELARRQVPEADFHVGSFLSFRMPPCRAITALGEVFNYLFDADNSLESLTSFWTRIFVEGLSAGGCLIFDVAVPGRCRGRGQAFAEGDDWTCLVEIRHDESNRQLSRRIVTFRKTGDAYRRHEETHRQQLVEEATVVDVLQRTGFRVQTTSSYGDYRLPEAVIGFIATKP